MTTRDGGGGDGAGDRLDSRPFLWPLSLVLAQMSDRIRSAFYRDNPLTQCKNPIIIVYTVEEKKKAGTRSGGPCIERYMIADSVSGFFLLSKGIEMALIVESDEKTVFTKVPSEIHQKLKLVSKSRKEPLYQLLSRILINFAESPGETKKQTA